MKRRPDRSALDQLRNGDRFLARPLQIAYPVEPAVSFSPDIARLMQQLSKAEEDEE